MVFLRTLLVTALLVPALGACGSDPPAPPAQREPAAEESVQLEGPKAEALVKVPDVTGMDGQEAVDAIEAEGLYASHDEDDPAGCTVKDQDETGEVEPETKVILTLDCRQRDWEDREGDAWDLFVSSFARGAEKGCDVLFSLSPTAVLYANGREYRSSDCSLATDEDPRSAAAEIPEEAPADPEALGISLGLVHGCNALFDSRLIAVLTYGNRSFTADRCVAALEVRHG